MAASESEIAAQLIERLLADPPFRDRFRRDPARACHEAGLESLAEEMRLGAGKAMHTLDIRESRSSLAGVMMAAAMEGMGVYEFSKHVVPHLDDIPAAVGDVLSRVNLPALPGAGALAGGPEQSSAPLVPEPPGEKALEGAAGNGTAPPAPPVDAEPAAPEAAKQAPSAPEEAAVAPPKEEPAKDAVAAGGKQSPEGGKPSSAAPVAPELARLGDSS